MNPGVVEAATALPPHVPEAQDALLYALIATGYALADRLGALDVVENFAAVIERPRLEEVMARAAAAVVAYLLELLRLLEQRQEDQSVIGTEGVDFLLDIALGAFLLGHR